MSSTTLAIQGIESFIAFLLALTISWWMTPKVSQFALQLGILDSPSARKIHQRPIARLGGVAIAFASVAAMILIFALAQSWLRSGFLSAAQHLESQWIIVGGLAYFSIGFADDIMNLSAKKRLVIQFLIAAFIWFMGVRVDCSQFPLPDGLYPDSLSLLITLIWIVGVVNAINWIDGLDGLAGGVSAIACIPLMVAAVASHQVYVSFIVAALAGGLLGFLVFNFNPASIFMGDGGSYFIGFVLASSSILCFLNDASVDGILPCFLALAVPICDMTWVIAFRLLERKSPFIADQKHLHHRLLKFGISHRNTVLLIYALSLCLGLASTLLELMPTKSSFFLILACSILIISSFVWAIIALLEKISSKAVKGLDLVAGTIESQRIKPVISEN